MFSWCVPLGTVSLYPLVFIIVVVCMYIWGEVCRVESLNL